MIDALWRDAPLLAVVALALVLFAVLARLATVQGPPPAHVDPGFFWLAVGAASGGLLLAVGASVRRVTRDAYPHLDLSEPAQPVGRSTAVCRPSDARPNPGPASDLAAIRLTNR